MKHITKICIALVVMIVCALPASAAFASDVIYPSSWMSEIDGNKKISEITIPGTHDSASQKMCLIAGTAGSVQNYSINEQVNGGVRLFDLRVGGAFEWNYFSPNRHLDPESIHDLIFYHGDLTAIDCRCFKEITHLPGFLGTEVPLKFMEVLDDLVRFAKDHPTETVLIAPRAEVGDKDIVRKYIKEAIKVYDSNIYQRTDKVPTLNEVRGKVVLLDIDEKLGMGLPIYLSGQCSVGDVKFITSDLYECDTRDQKLNELKQAFSDARKTKAGVIFTSGYTMLKGLLPDSLSMSNKINPQVPLLLEQGVSNGWIFSDFVKPSYEPHTKYEVVSYILKKMDTLADALDNPGQALFYTQLEASDVYLKNF